MNHNFHEKQLQAMKHTEGPALVLAGPGSGKTLVITQRIRYLITQKHISPFHILVITFSKSAALEMQKRCMELLSNQCKTITIATFHSFFYQILKEYYSYQNNSILNQSQKINYLKMSIFQLKMNINVSSEFLEQILELFAAKKSSIGDLKNISNILEENQFEKLFFTYNKLIHAEKKIDFEDMLLLSYKLLRTNQAVREQYQKRFTYLMVDEYQDVNDLQNELLKLLLSENQKNLFAVGDDDQSIYGFRGSNPKIMQRFMDTFPKAIKIILPYNYRSKKSIVFFSQQIIKENKNRFEKEIISYQKEEGSVNIQAFSNREKEYLILLRELKKHMEQQTLGECACLFRTNKDTAYLKQKLKMENIPYCAKESRTSVWEHFVFADIMHYLKLVEGYPGQIRQEDMYAVMNRPMRFISREAFPNQTGSFQELEQYYQNNRERKNCIIKLSEDCKRMKSMDLFARVNYIRKAVGYEAYLEERVIQNGEKTEDNKKALEEIQEKLRDIKSFKELQQEILLYNKEQKSRLSLPQSQKNFLNIMTFHAAKGLEFSHVYITDCNMGVIPHHKCQTEEEMEEERRMFYVAVTRAKESLSIYYLTKKEQTDRPIIASPFIEAYISSKSQLSKNSS